MNEKIDRQPETPDSSTPAPAETLPIAETPAAEMPMPEKSAVQEPEAQSQSPQEVLPEAPPPPEPPRAQTPPSPARNGSWFSPWLVIAVLALGLAAWQWMETRVRLAETQQEVAKRLANGDAIVKESQLLAKQSQEQLTALQAKLTALENQLAESKSQHEALENLYQNLARHTEESALVDIEQSVTLASEQLQLAGNVQGAVFALQAADSRLAGSNRPQFISLRKVFARDLERLRALPQMDLPGMYLRLENVMLSIDSLPIANVARLHEDVAASTPAEEVPSTESAVAEAPAGSTSAEGAESSILSSPLLSLGYWRALAGDLWKEVRSLVRIQRFDRHEPVLLAPGQDFFLRENLKLRLLNARLALLSRDQWTYRNELRRAQEWLERYFDAQEKSVQSGLTALKELSATEISNELPNLNDSLSAIKNFRADKERERERP